MRALRPAPFLMLLLLVGGAARPASVRAEAEAAKDTLPWIGLDGQEVFGDPGPASVVARLAGCPPLLVRSEPIPWGRVVPVAPVMGGRQLHDWAAVDAFVATWQAAGHDVVLTLDPQAGWLARVEGPSAWGEAVDRWIPEAMRPRLREAAAGARRALPPKRWDDWQAFVREVVERYDADGRDDAPGLRRPVRWIQVMEAPFLASVWCGRPEDYARLLHHAWIGAREASPTARIVHGGLDLPLRATGRGDGGSALLDTWEHRMALAPPPQHLEGRWRTAFAARTVGLAPVFDAVVLEGGGNLADEADGLAALGRLLHAEGRDEVEIWLGRTHPLKVEASAIERPAGPSAAERRLRSRWLAAGRLTGHGEHDEAVAWLERGKAFDLVRTLVFARLAGARRVFVGHPGVGNEGRGLGGAAAALAQAVRRLGTATGARPVDAGAGVRAVRFDGTDGAWVLAVLADPDESWAGEPGAPLSPEREVVLRLPPGAYAVEPVATGGKEPEPARREAREGLLRLAVGPSPLYVRPWTGASSPR